MRCLVAAALLLALSSSLTLAEEPPVSAGAAGQGAVPSGSDAGFAAAKLALLEERVAWLRELLENVRRMHAEGDASDTDLAQVEARLSRARADQALLRGQLREAEARYEPIVGQPPPGAPAEGSAGE